MFWYKGNRFEELDDVAKRYELTFSELMERIQLSSTGVITLRKGYYGMRNTDRYAFGNRVYARLEDVADDLGVSYVTLLSRVKVCDDGVIRFKRGFSDFSKKSFVKDVDETYYTYDGQDYDGLSVLSDVTGVATSVLKRIVKGYERKDVTEIVNGYIAGIKKFRVVDADYRYVKEVAELFDIRRVYLDRDLRKGMSLERAVVRALDMSFLGVGGGSYVYEGERYADVLTLYERVTERKISFYAFVSGMWLGTYADRVTISQEEKKVTYTWKGETYHSMKELSEACGVSHSSLKRLSSRYGSVEEALTFLMDHTKQKKYLLNGEYFSSMSEMMKHTKLSAYGFRKDILYSGMVKKRGADGKYYRYYG